MSFVSSVSRSKGGIDGWEEREEREEREVQRGRGAEGQMSAECGMQIVIQNSVFIIRHSSGNGASSGSVPSREFQHAYNTKRLYLATTRAG